MSENFYIDQNWSILKNKSFPSHKYVQSYQKFQFYRWVYKNLLIDDQNVRKFLDEAEIEKLFNLEQHFVHVDTIFKRVFSK